MEAERLDGGAPEVGKWLIWIGEKLFGFSPLGWRVVPAIVGSVLPFAVWIDSLITHPGARYAGPIWLLLGLAVFVVVRRARGEGRSITVI